MENRKLLLKRYKQRRMARMISIIIGLPLQLVLFCFIGEVNHNLDFVVWEDWKFGFLYNLILFALLFINVGLIAYSNLCPVCNKEFYSRSSMGKTTLFDSVGYCSTCKRRYIQEDFMFE